MLGDAEAIVGLDDWRVTYKTVERAGYTVETKSGRSLRVYDQRENDDEHGQRPQRYGERLAAEGVWAAN
jgi:hypothetical protein